jgi:Ca2+-binding RTX toxin-like protein
MPSVTITGTNSQGIVLNFDSSSNYALAAQIAAQINAGVAAGTVVTFSDVDGLPPAVAAGKVGAYYQTQTGSVVMSNGYAIDLVTKSGSAVVQGGSGANGIGYEEVLSDERTNLTFLASGGAGSVVAGGGTSRLSVSGGNWSLNTGNGNDAIFASNGSDTISAGGGTNAINLSNGSFVVESTGNDRFLIGSGAVTVDATFASSDFIQGGSSSLYFLGGSGGATIFGGTGSDTYFGAEPSSGPQLIFGGSAGNNFLWASDGPATLVGGGANDQLYAYGGSDQMLKAGSRNETLSAAFSSGNNTLIGGSGADILEGGSGADTFVAGSGSATISAGSSSDVFEFIKGQAGGQELVQGYLDASSIKIHLQGYAPEQVANALASQTVSNGSVTISLSDGTTVTFQNITALHGSNFG